MKIGNPSEKPAPAHAASGAAPADAAKGEHGAAARVAPDASAKIELSTTAATLLSSGGSAEFDADKVARMTQAISDGSFKVNPEAIADKLIANASEVLNKARH